MAKKKKGFIEFKCYEMGGKTLVNIDKILAIKQNPLSENQTIVVIDTLRKDMDQILVEESFDSLKELLG